MRYPKLFTTLFLVAMFAIVASVKVSKNHKERAESTSAAETETEIKTEDVHMTDAQFQINLKPLKVTFEACKKECKQKNSAACKEVCFVANEKSYWALSRRFNTQKCARIYPNICN